jgi:hypothetical protein
MDYSRISLRKGEGAVLNNSDPCGDFLKSAGRRNRSISYGRLSPRDPFRRQGPARSRTGRRQGEEAR